MAEVVIARWYWLSSHEVELIIKLPSLRSTRGIVSAIWRPHHTRGHCINYVRTSHRDLCINMLISYISLLPLFYHITGRCKETFIAFNLFDDAINQVYVVVCWVYLWPRMCIRSKEHISQLCMYDVCKLTGVLTPCTRSKISYPRAIHATRVTLVYC